MTREEAIALLSMIEFDHAECCLNTWYKGIDDNMKEALDMAIKALEKESCEDAISRANTINEVMRIMLDHPLEGYEDEQLILKTIQDMPPVTPAEGQKFCGDAISRKAAIEQIQRYGVGCFDADDFSPEECERFVIHILEALQPDTAYWIMSEVRQSKTLICSKCRIDLGSICPTNYCPNCGRLMMQEVEE